jgi:hypothetical protein
MGRIIQDGSRGKVNIFEGDRISDIVKAIKIRRLKWMGHLVRMQDLDPSRKLTFLKPGSTRRVGESKMRWFESVEEYLKKMGVRNL